MNWTKEQALCVHHGDGSLIVSAAAGSGKTAVLTARIIELVRSRRANVDSLLVVTFTKAAASEMLHRIRAGLLEALRGASEADAGYLSRQIELLGRAHVGTVHAFCARLLRRHFHEAGLDPAFRVADEIECGAMMLEAAEEALEEAALEADEAFLALFDRFGGRDGQGLIDLALRLYAFTRSQADIAGYLKKSLAHYGADMDTLLRSNVISALMDEAKRLLERALRCAKRARAALSPPENALAVLDDDIAKLNALLFAWSKGLDEFSRHLAEHDFAALRFSETQGELRERVKALREQEKECVKALPALFPLTLEEELHALHESRPALEALCAFMERFAKLYAEKKETRGIVDFADLEHKTLLALNNEAVANEYRGRFRYVFMDEYQDSNRVQEAIIERVSKDGNRFLVGDVKQSIYRFRLADPEIFMEKYGAWQDGNAGARVDLPDNFRSATNVITTVNALFGSLMTRSLGGVDYAGHALVARRSESGALSEFHFFDGDASKEDAEETQEATQREALFAAKKIASLVGKPLTPGAPPLKYSDCAVLLRSTREAALVWARAFALSGIPVRADAIGGIFAAIEVQVLRSLLRCIDNRRLDVPLLSVMRSPMFGFTDAQIVTIRLNKGAAVIDDVAAAFQAGGPLGEKCGGLIAALERWKLDARLLPVGELIASVLTETGYRSVVSAMPGGARRAANLDAFLEHARAANARSLWAFLRFLDSLERAKRPLPGKAAGEAEAVRILSVHKSKGLEFPLVIVAGLGKKFNFSDANEPVQFDAMGIGVKYVKPDERLGFDSLTKAAFRVRTRRETLSEELRILYVALTRARDALICVGTAANLQKRAQKALFAASPDYAAAPVDWLLYALRACEQARGLYEGDTGEAPASLPVIVLSHTGREQTPPRAATDKLAVWREKALLADTEAVEQSFRFEYPYADASGVPSKLSISELLAQEELALRAPAFLSEVTASEIGTLAHDVLMRIDLSGPCDVIAVETLLSQMAQAQNPRRELIGRVDPGSIAGFLHSPLGVRLRRAGKAERELRFQLLSEASMLTGVPSRESIVLQGVIDCCFLEGEEWIIIDYKTDYVPAGFDTAARKHERQLRLYAYALENLTGKPVKESYVHFLRYGKSVLL